MSASDSEQQAAMSEHVLMADRIELISWGDGSMPSIPVADYEKQETTEDDMSIDGNGSLTSSLRSSLYDYIVENGRTYHRYKEGKYLLPNDIEEQARLDMQHAIFLFTTHGRIFVAPVENPRRALDIGTGTGIWAIEFSMMFPDADVVGTDLSPIQPRFVPENCHFEIDDFEDEWTFARPFDFIHGRGLMPCLRDPAALFRSAFDACAPGGYFEMQDAEIPVHYASPPPSDSAIVRFNDLLVRGSIKAGRPWSNVIHYEEYMRAAGFENVTTQHFYWPLSPWPRGTYYKTLGGYVLEDLLNAIEGYSLKLFALLGMSYDEIQALLSEVRHDLLSTKTHAYLDLHYVWGRKPFHANDGTAK